MRPNSKIFLSLAFCWLLSGCSLFQEKKMGQAATKNFETREVDAPFNQVYEAGIEALFDLGYTIIHSDKESGILVGEKGLGKGKSAWIFKDKKLEKVEKEVPDLLQLTLLVKSLDKKTTKVRIKTAINKERQLDKQAIDEMWVTIQRQVLMEEPPLSPVSP